MVLFLGGKNPTSIPKALNFCGSTMASKIPLSLVKCLHNFGPNKLLSGLMAKIPLASWHKVVLILNYTISTFVNRIRNFQLCVPQKVPAFLVRLAFQN